MEPDNTKREFGFNKKDEGTEWRVPQTEQFLSELVRASVRQVLDEQKKSSN